MSIILITISLALVLRLLLRAGLFLFGLALTILTLLLGLSIVLAAEPGTPYGALPSNDGQTYVQRRENPYGPPEPRAGGITLSRRGDWLQYDTDQPGAYRVYGGTVVTGVAQDPGCGGGWGQYACPNPIFIPDNGARPCRITPGIGCID